MTIAVPRPAGPPYLNASLSDSAAVSPWTSGPGDVLGGGRLVGERRAEALEQPLEVLARGPWSAVRISSSWTAVAVWVIGIVAAVVELGRARAARPEVEEEVALEEQARADLDLGVGVDRLALLVDA